MFVLPKKKFFTWQQQCLELWLKNGGRGIVNVVTGAGKTLLALGAAHYLEKQTDIKLKVKIVVPKIFLASQWKRAIMDELSVSHEQIGLYTGTIKNKISKKYMIYVVNSARYTLSRHILADLEKGHTVFLICDECHHYGSDENAKIFDFLPFLPRYKGGYFSLGLSATPEAEHFESILVPALGKEIYQYNLLNAVNAKIIADFSIFNVALAFSPAEREEYNELSDKLKLLIGKLKILSPGLKQHSDGNFYAKLQAMCEWKNQDIASAARTALLTMYARKEIVHTAISRLECTVELIRRLDADSKIIIFGERIQMTDALHQRLCRNYPGQIVKYHSEMDAQANKIALYKYQNGEARMLVCCRALDEGLNVPDTDIGIILSSTSSSRQRIQRMGRILRRGGNVSPKSIYYLHIPESSEEDGLIEENMHGGDRVAALIYNMKTNDFSQPLYDAAAEKLLWNMQTKEADKRLLAELERNIKIGVIRRDWKLSEQECLQNIKEAESKAKRNYWQTMLRIGRFKEMN